MKSLVLAAFLALLPQLAISQEVPDCSRVADIAAAIRAGNNQRARDLMTDASGLEIQAARMGERGAPANLGPKEVRRGVLRACLQAAR